MLAATLHREDIKAVLRKRHGSVQRFADAHEVKGQAVADFLRGRSSAHVAELVEAELQKAVHDGSLVIESTKLDNSAETSDAHRQNAGAE